MTQKPWGVQLARELGLEDQLLPTHAANRQVFVLHKGRPTPLPEGLLLIAPTKFLPFALSPLISPLGKLRMALDLWIPPRRDNADETLASYIRRRLGREALDTIAEPLLGGIYNAEVERQSLLATFPRLRMLEAEHGSLIKGMLAARRRQNTGKSENERNPSSAFISFVGGMQVLPQALQSQLTGDCRLRTQVETLERNTDGRYTLHLTGGTQCSARTLVLAIPAYAAADLVQALAPAAAETLKAIRYVGTGTLSLAFRRAEITSCYAGFGLVVPRREQRSINAITWTSTKFDGRAPHEYALLRVFFGGSRSPHMMEYDDDSLLAEVRQELSAMAGIEAQPLFHRIYRWRRSTPQYDVGHLERVTAIEAALPAGLYVTGSPYRGIGIPDCVRQAQQTAQSVLTFLSARM